MKRLPSERRPPDKPSLTSGPLSMLALLLGCGTCTHREREPELAPRMPQSVDAAPREPNSHRTPEQTGRPAETLDPERETQLQRERMVTNQLEDQGIGNPRVLQAMRHVPRHRFVLEDFRATAYADRPLPIVGKQTISQPYIVAFMTEAAEISPPDRCLEIGTGSGYQAAVLTEVCKVTYSIEYLPEVAAYGRRNLEQAGYLERALHLRVGDGYEGWQDAAPFDAIIVTAAPARVPQPLLDQLALGGKLVIPVGPERGLQRLEVWTRLRPGSGRRPFRRNTLIGVRFVPFLGPQGQ